MRLARAALAALLLPSASLACSGEGALELMASHQRFGWIAFGVAVAAVLGTIAFLLRRRRLRAWHLPALAALPIHPALWLSAYIGDCGTSRVGGSALMTSLCIAWTALVLRSPSPRRR
jgi:hypothetical protein